MAQVAEIFIITVYLPVCYVGGIRCSINSNLLAFAEKMEIPLSAKTANWRFYESAAYDIDLDGFEEFDSIFDKMKKEYSYSQEVFLILSRAFIEV